MATNVLTLPQLSGTLAAVTNGDLRASIMFQEAGGSSPLDLTGIAFRSQWRLASDTTQIGLVTSTDNGLLINGGANGMLSWLVPAATMKLVAAGAYEADMLAIADGAVINLFPSAPLAVVSALTLTSVALAADVGPPGPAGPAGALAFCSAPFIGVAAGQTVALPASVGAFFVLVINGMVELPANYSVDGAMLTIPPGLVWDGADCLFLFTAPPSPIAAIEAPVPIVASFTVSKDAETFSVDQPIAAAALYLDGLRQGPENFSFSGATISLSPGAASPGDHCLIEYTPV